MTRKMSDKRREMAKENFLSTMDMSFPIYAHIWNVYYDAKLYNWPKEFIMELENEIKAKYDRKAHNQIKPLEK